MTLVLQPRQHGRYSRVYAQSEDIEERLAVRRPVLMDAIARGDRAAVLRIQADNRRVVGLRW